MQRYEKVRFLWFLLMVVFMCIIGFLPVTVAHNEGLNESVINEVYQPATSQPISVTIEKQSLPTADSSFPIEIAGRTCYLRGSPSLFPTDADRMTVEFWEYVTGDDRISWGMEMCIDNGNGNTVGPPLVLGLPVLPGEKAVTMMSSQGWGEVQGVLEGEYRFIPVSQSGIYAVIFSSNLPEAPVIKCHTDMVNVDNAAGGSVWYTVDGSDPRQSETAVLYDQPFHCSGSIIKAAVYQDGFWSEPVSETMPCASEEQASMPVNSLNDEDQQVWRDVQPLAQTEMEILPSQGGRLDLSGIASLDIPPDALPADRSVLVRLIALDPPLEVAQDHTSLSPVVWVRFRGLSSPVLNQPLQLSIQLPVSASEPMAVRLWEAKTAASGASQAVLNDQGATITIKTGGRFWLAEP